MLRRFTQLAVRWQQLCCQDRCLHSTAAAASFSFAAAISNHGNLYNAIHECVNLIEEQLPLKDVHFCQLLVSTKHASTLAHAPQCLLDNLGRTLDLNEGPPAHPVVIGGALQAAVTLLQCHGSFTMSHTGGAAPLDPGLLLLPHFALPAKSVCGSGRSPEATPGVSLLAGHMPGVQLMPFHVGDASLPPFTAQQWASLLHTHTNHSSSSSSSSSVSTTSAGSAAGADSNACAAIVLSAPHFTEVESFLQRLSSALPNIPVVGGVTQKDAWTDTENEYGALFCGPEVSCNGAVGVVMQGPLVMRHILQQSGRQSGRVMTVTQAADNVILALDNRPVHDSRPPIMHALFTQPVLAWGAVLQFVDLLHSLPTADQKKELLLGITDNSIAGAGTDSSQHFVARSMHLSSTTYGRPVLVVAAHAVPVGARVRLLVRDFEHNYQQQKHSLAAVAKQLPPATLTRPKQLTLLSYCCIALPHSEANVVAQVLPQVPFVGGRMQGEFAGSPCTANCPPTTATGQSSTAPAVAMGGATLHSYAASFAVLHHAC